MQPTYNVEARRDELFREYVAAHASASFQTHAPNTPEWEAASKIAAWNVAIAEGDMLTDPGHCEWSSAEMHYRNNPEQYTTVVARIQERGY